MSDLTVFQCGPPKDHKCDDNGPQVWGLGNGEITSDESRARKERCSWGSVTCSVCGMSSMERSMWESE